MTMSYGTGGILSYCFRSDDGTILEEKSPGLPLMPASNMKILTGYSAYSILGGNFVFRTRFSRKGKTLTVSGDPCPLLSRAALAEVLESLEISSGAIDSVVFDDTVLDGKEYADGWSIEDIGFCYQTRIFPYTVEEGCFCGDCGEIPPTPLHDYARQAVPDQMDSFAEEVRRVTGCRVGTARGRAEELPESAEFVHEEKLMDILGHIETYSCNFSAEILVKYIWHHLSGGQGTWEGGTGTVLRFMEEMGLDTRGVRIVDGSGLSRLNLISSSFLSDLVFRIRERGDMDFINILPTTGRGTLQNRLSHLASHNIHAKTGSIDHCSSLTGYIGSLGVSFSIIINNSTEDEEKLREKIDSVLESFISRSGK